MMNDPTPLGPHEPRALQAPTLTVTLALKDLSKYPIGALFGSRGTLAGTFPPIWTLTEGPPRRMPWPDASLRCLDLVSLWGPTFSSNTATTYFLASNLQLVVYSRSLFIYVRVSRCGPQNFRFIGCHSVPCRIWKTWCERLEMSPMLMRTRTAEMKGKSSLVFLSVVKSWNEQNARNKYIDEATGPPG